MELEQGPRPIAKPHINGSGLQEAALVAAAPHSTPRAVLDSSTTAQPGTARGNCSCPRRSAACFGAF